MTVLQTTKRNPACEFPLRISDRIIDKATVVYSTIIVEHKEMEIPDDCVTLIHNYVYFADLIYFNIARTINWARK